MAALSAQDLRLKDLRHSTDTISKDAYNLLAIIDLLSDIGIVPIAHEVLQSAYYQVFKEQISVGELAHGLGRLFDEAFISSKTSQPVIPDDFFLQYVVKKGMNGNWNEMRLKDLRRAFVESRNGECLFMLGTYLTNDSRHRLALDCFKLAVEQDPTNALWIKEVARASFNLREYATVSEAIDLLVARLDDGNLRQKDDLRGLREAVGRLVDPHMLTDVEIASALLDSAGPLNQLQWFGEAEGAARSARAKLETLVRKDVENDLSEVKRVYALATIRLVGIESESNDDFGKVDLLYDCLKLFEPGDDTKTEIEERLTTQIALVHLRQEQYGKMKIICDRLKEEELVDGYSQELYPIWSDFESVREHLESVVVASKRGPEFQGHAMQYLGEFHGLHGQVHSLVQFALTPVNDNEKQSNQSENTIFANGCWTAAKQQFKGAIEQFNRLTPEDKPDLWIGPLTAAQGWLGISRCYLNGFNYSDSKTDQESVSKSEEKATGDWSNGRDQVIAAIQNEISKLNHSVEGVAKWLHHLGCFHATMIIYGEPNHLADAVSALETAFLLRRGQRQRETLGTSVIQDYLLHRYRGDVANLTADYRRGKRGIYGKYLRHEDRVAIN